MANTKKAAPPAQQSGYKIVTHNITVRSNDRTKKDVKTWRNAHIYAESVTNPQRVSLYNVYEDIRLDGHLIGITRKRIDSVLNKRLVFKKGESPVTDMQKTIQSKVFRSIIEEILLSRFWGISGIEFIPGEKLAFNRIPRKHIKPEQKFIAMEQYATTGIPYVGVPNIWIIGDADDLGLYLPCGFYALLKKGAVSDWAEYIELFGSPIICMYYDAGDRQTELKIDNVLDTMGNSTRLKLPNQAKLDVKDGKGSNGNGDLQGNFRKAMNEEMSVIVLGNTETTASSSSSGYAQSETHADQQLEIIKSDMLDVLDYLNSDQFIAILRSYGLPVEGGMFEYDSEVDINFMLNKIKVVKELHAIGLPLSKKDMYKTFSVDEPKAGDELGAPEPGDVPGDGVMVSDSRTTKPKRKPKKPVAEDLSDDQAPVTMADMKKMLTDFFGLAL